MPRNRRSTLPPVALGGVVEEASLPLPWTEYPQHYGTLFRYSPTRDGPFRFCACARHALTNLARLNAAFPVPRNAAAHRMALLDSLFVPIRAAEETVGWTLSDLGRLRFYEGVCHRCSRVPPAQRWCHEMYGDPWKQAYGWFPYAAALEGGVDPWHIERHLPTECPPEVRPDLADYLPLHEEWHRCVFTERMDPNSIVIRDLRRNMQAVKSRVMRFFTSEARVAFGFKRVGEGWVSETMLFRIVQGLWPDVRLIRHYRPDWLDGLELDIYAPALNVGIEYQGEQHSEPVEHWGGAAALERQQLRDAKKKALCEKQGCRLVEVLAGTELTAGAIGRLLRGIS